jgi:hypothetical protein
VSLETARAEFASFCAQIGSTDVDEENAILSVGREHLPPCAIAVIEDRDAATEQYYEWLLSQTAQAQAEHEARRGW